MPSQSPVLYSPVVVFALAAPGCGVGTTVDWELVPREFVVAELHDTVWAVDPLTDGLLVARSEKTQRIERFVAPWQESSPEAGLLGSYRFLVTDADGRLILAQRETAKHNYRWVVWDRKTRKVITFDGLDILYGSLNGAGELVALREREGATIISTTTGKPSGRSPHLAHGAKLMVWCPNGDLLLGQYGSITRLESGSWQPTILKTAARDQAEWQARATRREDESGYHPHENATSLTFSPDGKLLICTMDRGLRVFQWDEVVAAENELPAPTVAVDGELVDVGWSLLRQAYSAVCDADRKLILWGGLENKIHLLDLVDGNESTLFELPEGASVTRLALLTKANILCCEATAIHGQKSRPRTKLLLLDYPRLLKRAR
jgi:hypothetical protein